MIDILGKRCEYDNCNTYVKYGKLFEKKIHCGKHKSNNEYTRIHPICLFSECKNVPYYTNDNTGFPKRCEQHKLSNDINIIERECSKCNMRYFIPSNRTECNDCYEYFTNKVYHVKEERVKQILQSNGIDYYIHDRSIEDGCSQRRPDFVIDKGQYQLVIEVDENQHGSYSTDCEDVRMKQIYFDFGGYPIIFIRYNPDEYIDNLGNKITYNANRERILIKFIKNFNNIAEWNYPLTVLYLFYDGWNNTVTRRDLDPY